MSKRRHPLRSYNSRRARAPWRPRLTITVAVFDRVTGVFKQFEQRMIDEIVASFRMTYPELTATWAQVDREARFRHGVHLANAQANAMLSAYIDPAKDTPDETAT